MKLMIRLSYRAIFAIYTAISYCLFFIKCRSERKRDTIIFLDIDNTIADTWPTLVNTNAKSDFERLADLPRLDGTYHYIKEKLNSHNVVVFLSNRPFFLHGITFSWLKRNSFKPSLSSLFLVPKPETKLAYYKVACKYFSNVTIIDDCSYDHESGKVRHYDNVVAELTALHATYIGYSEINKMNNQNDN